MNWYKFCIDTLAAIGPVDFVDVVMLFPFPQASPDPCRWQLDSLGSLFALLVADLGHETLMVVAC